MKRLHKFIGMIAVLFTAALYMFDFSIDAPTLAVCVDWITGFTSHLDAGSGISLATGAAAIAGVKGDDDKEERSEDGDSGEIEFDVNSEAGRAALEAVIEQRMKQLAAKESDKRTVDVNPPAGDEDGQPVVKGERVMHWQRRGYQAIQSVGMRENPDHGLRQKGNELFARGAEMHFGMADSQRKEEEAIARSIVDDAFADKRISAKGKQRVYNLLDDPEEREFLSQAKRGHSTLTGPGGAFLLPKPMLATIYTHIEEYGLAPRLCENVVLSSKDLDLNSIATANAANWAGEASLLTESDIELGVNKLGTSKLGAVSWISTEQEEDQIVPLIPAWLDKLAENIGLKIDQSVFIGDGTSAYGGFTGITELPSAQFVTLGAGDLAPADVTETDYRNTKRLLSVGRRMRAQWVMPRVMWDYIEEFESTVGARIVQELLTQDATMRLMTFPANITEAMDNTDSDVANRDFAILGDFSRTKYGVRRGVTVETSREGVLSNSAGAITFNALQQDGVIVKVSLRVGHQTPTGLQDGYAIMRAPAS